MMHITIPIAPGELIDKITILEIKSERVTDATKLANVRAELALLEHHRDAAIVPSAELDRLTAKLSAINAALWDIEDRIRVCEQVGDFGPAFTELARAVYRTNDERAVIKRRINRLLDSDIIEEKSYAPYA